jgi:hypothetical protein
MPSTITKIEASHPTTQMTTAGATNVRVLKVEVCILGALNKLNVTGLNFGAKGTLANQLSEARVYFTGDMNAFATTTQFGSPLSAPIAGGFNFTSATGIELEHGPNYF